MSTTIHEIDLRALKSRRDLKVAFSNMTPGQQSTINFGGNHGALAITCTRNDREHEFDLQRHLGHHLTAVGALTRAELIQLVFEELTEIRKPKSKKKEHHEFDLS